MKQKSYTFITEENNSSPENGLETYRGYKIPHEVARGDYSRIFQVNTGIVAKILTYSDFQRTLRSDNEAVVFLTYRIGSL